MKKIEHLVIAVHDLDASNTLFEKLLGVAPYKQKVVPTEGVLTSFFQMAQTK
tara:strand:+ start:3576 stop:3731 length:156 start_codon:yes stop_codon:yes gene_type:complete